MRRNRFASLICVVAAALLAAPVVPVGARATTTGTVADRELWARVFDDVDYDESLAGLAVSPDGSMVFVTGTSFGAVATIAYDAATGARHWTRRYGPPGGGAAPTDLAMSPDGQTVFVVGTGTGADGTYDLLTIAYRATTGDRIWLEQHDGGGDGQDTAYAVDVARDGSGFDSLSLNYLTVAYRADTGAQVWARRFDGGNHLDDVAYDVAASPDGSAVFVSGTSRAWLQFHDSCQCYTWAYDYVTLAYDGATGDVSWARRRAHDDGSELVEPTRPALALAPDSSRLFVTTTRFGRETYVDMVTYAYDTAAGHKLWGTRYAGQGNSEDVSESLAVSPDGTNVVVVGSTAGEATDRRGDYAMIAYRARSGVERWRRAYDGPDGLSDAARAVAVDPDGTTVYVTGGSQWGATRPEGSDIATVAYAIGDGSRRSVARYRAADPADGFLGTEGTAIGSDPAGSTIFVAGTRTAPAATGADFVTLAYRT
jgi:DNA-binding beta-propeller fold protein YncE